LLAISQALWQWPCEVVAIHCDLLKTKAPAQFRWQFSREIVVEKANAAQITILPKVTRNSAREVIGEEYYNLEFGRENLILIELNIMIQM
jgi:hypothetical protein